MITYMLIVFLLTIFRSQQHVIIFITHTSRPDDPDHASEFKDPGEDSRTHRDFGLELEVFLIHGLGFHLAAEVVNDRIHGSVVTEESLFPIPQAIVSIFPAASFFRANTVCILVHIYLSLSGA